MKYFTFFLCALLTAGLCAPRKTFAFDLVEFDLNIEVNLPVYSFDYKLADLPSTGFTLYNPEQQSLEVRSAFIPQLGLLPGEKLQPGFVMYDGTLLLEVAATDTTGGRADIRTTYRMTVGGRQLERTFLRDLFIRQGRYDSGRAQIRARAARLADARIMRFDESEGRWIRAVRAIRANGGRADVRFLPRMEPDGVLGHYGYNVDTQGNSYVWAVVDKNSRYAVGINVDDDNDGVFNKNDTCRNSTMPGDLVDTEGCSIQDRCSCTGKRGWRSRLAWMRCAVKTRRNFASFRLFRKALKQAILSGAARSRCGEH